LHGGITVAEVEENMTVELAVLKTELPAKKVPLMVSVPAMVLVPPDEVRFW
jgi:hypothetical protein